MPDNRVPKRPFSGEVKALILRGLCPPGLSRSGFIDVALPDFKKCQIGSFTGMHKTDCSERQDLSCMYLAHHELESI